MDPFPLERRGQPLYECPSCRTVGIAPTWWKRVAGFAVLGPFALVLLGGLITAGWVLVELLLGAFSAGLAVASVLLFAASAGGLVVTSRTRVRLARCDGLLSLRVDGQTVWFSGKL
ncbi:MAG: hypothetical protein SFW67_23250 [Myxococcaceae bacterium]|nr:hypothetical protein [Myxococcaceae bacterium]